MIRRTKVLNALRWLKKYYKWYREDADLIIDELSLDWMNGAEEAEFTNIQFVEESMQHKQDPKSSGHVCELYMKADQESNTDTILV